ncbi:MAG TPA: protein kinase [Longimicrobiales bacterium]|nr:protein kinase [Longimicrobiales bacterium]
MDTAVCPSCGNTSDASARHCSRCGTRLAESGPVDFLGARLRQRTEGRYRIGGRLGSGGMAAVYEAWDSLDRRWAIKVLSDVLLSQPAMVERFEREARTVLRLRHPNIVQLHSFEPHEDLHFLVLEFVEGVSLGERLAQTGGVSLEEGLRWFEQLASALDYAHSQQVIHRDIKPDNILVRPSGDVVITDFGIAKVLGGVSGLTHTGMAIGTGYYMAPEQWLGSEVTGAADQYALGVVLFEVLSGRRPFEKGSITALMTAHLTESPPDLGALVGDVPDPVSEAIGRMLAKEPGDRFPTLAEAAATVLGERGRWGAGDAPGASGAPAADGAAEPGTPPAAGAAPGDDAGRLGASDVVPRGEVHPRERAVRPGPAESEPAPPAPSPAEAVTSTPERVGSTQEPESPAAEPGASSPGPGPSRSAPPLSATEVLGGTDARRTARPPAVPPVDPDAPPPEPEPVRRPEGPELRPAWWPWVAVAGLLLLAMPVVWWAMSRAERSPPPGPTEILFRGAGPLEIPGVGQERLVRVGGRGADGVPASAAVSGWAVDDSTVAAVDMVDDTTARVVGLRAGETRIHASAGELAAALVVRVSGPEEPTGAETATVQGPGPSTIPTVASPAFELDPGEAVGMEVGEERMVAARAASGPVPEVDWSVGDDGLVEIRPAGPGQVTVRGRAPGRTVLRARGAGTVDSVPVVISPEAVASVAVDPEALELVTGDEATLSAVVAGPRSPRLDRTTAWASRDPAVATVDAGGTLRAVGDGSTWVVASAGGVSDSIAIRVASPATPVDGSVDVSTGDGTLDVGVSFAASAPSATTFCVASEVQVGEGAWIRSATRRVEAGPDRGVGTFQLSFADLGLPDVGNAERRLRVRGLAWRGGCPPPPGQGPDATVATGEACLVRYVTRDWAVDDCG